MSDSGDEANSGMNCRTTTKPARQANFCCRDPNNEYVTNLRRCHELEQEENQNP